MTNDAKLILESLFNTIWRIFTDWTIPGTYVTPAAFFLFIAFAGLGLRFMYRLLGLNPPIDSIPTSSPPPPDMLNTPRLNAPGRNRGVFGYGPGWSWTHRD